MLIASLQAAPHPAGARHCAAAGDTRLSKAREAFCGEPLKPSILEITPCVGLVRSEADIHSHSAGRAAISVTITFARANVRRHAQAHGVPLCLT